MYGKIGVLMERENFISTPSRPCVGSAGTGFFIPQILMYLHTGVDRILGSIRYNLGKRAAVHKIHENTCDM